MNGAYKWVLVALGVLLPVLILTWGNRFRSRRETFLRAVIAIVVGWGWLVIGRVIVNEVDTWGASPAQLEDLYRTDGGANAFVLVMGWVPPLVIVLVTWAVVRVWRARAPR